jgi:glycosyltransferase involved in cell wall biosynthesis
MSFATGAGKPVVFDGTIGIQQRVLPHYRVPFFDNLSAAYTGGLQVFSGSPRASEGIVTSDRLEVAQLVRAHNVHIGRGALYLCWQRNLGAWLREYDPDVLVAAADPRLPSTYRAIKQMHRRGRPVVGWGLGTLELTGGWRSKSPIAQLRTRFYKSFDAMIAYSAKGASDYVDAGIAPESVFVAPNSVSTAVADAALARYPSGAPEILNWRAELELSRPTVVFVGRMVPQKRLDVLIQACADLGDMCDLVMVGDGTDRPSLEAQAADVFPRTKFLGHLSGDPLSLALLGSDLFVQPGSGGLAAYEAMAYGKPLIVSSVGGDGTERELVQDGRNGKLVAPGDPSVLADAIRDQLEDPTALGRAGHQSRRIATGYAVQHVRNR